MIAHSKENTHTDLARRNTHPSNPKRSHPKTSDGTRQGDRTYSLSDPSTPSRRMTHSDHLGTHMSRRMHLAAKARPLTMIISSGKERNKRVSRVKRTSLWCQGMSGMSRSRSRLAVTWSVWEGAQVDPGGAPVDRRNMRLAMAALQETST